MFINRATLFLLFISTIAFSQTQKKVDTVFVHEKVFVYKTLSKTKKQIQTVVLDSIAQKRFSKVTEFKMAIVADTSLSKIRTVAVKKDSKKTKNPFLDNYGITIHSLFSQEPEIKNYGGGIGFVATKNMYRNKLYLNLEFLFSKVFSLAESKPIDGYFITPDAILYYQAQNVNTQQLDLPIMLSWKYKKFKPQIGIAFTQKQTELDFSSYKNNTTFSTVLKTSYKITNNYVDFMYGVEYEITKRIGIVLRSKQTIVKKKDKGSPENLKQLSELHFFPNQVHLGVVYNFKKQ